MFEIINNFLLAGDKFMPDLHLRQSGFTYSDLRLFGKHLERIQKFKEAGELKHICKNKLDKTSFAYDAVYANSKDL